jgi:hypothetical protein
MDTPDFFRVGDRVQLTVPFDSLPSGRGGVIRWVYFPIEAYRVPFDSEPVPRLVYGPDLVREPPAWARAVSA